LAMESRNCLEWWVRAGFILRLNTDIPGDIVEYRDWKGVIELTQERGRNGLQYPFRACVRLKKRGLAFFSVFDAVRLKRVFNQWKEGTWFNLPKLLRRPGPNVSLLTLIIISC
jgi:hypothetical protein